MASVTYGKSIMSSVIMAKILWQMKLSHWNYRLMAEWGVWVSGLNIEKKWQEWHQIDFIVLIVQYNVTKKN